MHIGMVSPYSLSVPGGVQGQVIGLTRALRRRGHTVHVLAPADGPTGLSGVTVVGPSVVNEANGSMAPISPHAPTQLRTMRALWDGDFDVLHLHEPFVPGPTATALMLRPAPIVGTFHAAGDQPMYKSMSSLVRWFGTRIDAKVAVSPAARNLAAVALADPWTILFNGLELDGFADLEPWSEPGRPRSDRPTILFVGRHEERKGLGVLLEALAGLSHDVEVWIAGAGPQTAELRHRFAADRRLRWLGFIGDVERDRRMAAATVFVAPALGGESFGIVLVEAMAAGAPVVAAANEGYGAVAGPSGDDPAAALLVEPGDPAALGVAIASILDDPDLAETMRQRGRRRAARFSMDHLAEAYLVLYENVIAEQTLSARSRRRASRPVGLPGS
ncbi:MAG: glycosyltransferase family 4 protein [Microthrixaceae bacterium]